MAFELQNVVPWGRTLEEYKQMFALSENDCNSNIISFGDGPASFNFEMTEQQKRVLSLDPIYAFSAKDLEVRIAETKKTVLEQVAKNADTFVWKQITSISHLEQIRIQAMSAFIADFELGKSEGRYICHELPNKTTFANLEFDLGLSSHFLLLYSQLGLEFHITSVSEMLRICKEVRIFPICNLNAETSEVLDGVIAFFENDYEVSIQEVEYEFQKNGNKMLTIKQK